MGKLNDRVLKRLIEKPGRYADGDGLFFKTVGQGRAYWTFRYSAHGKAREMSLGPYPELSLDAARTKHLRLVADVRDKIDPLAGKRAKGKTGSPAALSATGVPTFGAMAENYVETHEGSWRSAKHRSQWRMTLTKYCQPIWDTPVNEIDTAAVLSVLRPLWARASETGSRLRGRVEATIDAARALGHIVEDKANPARWKGHLDKLLPKPKKLASGNHKALPYDEVPALMKRLAGIDNVPAKALMFTILTAARSDEALGAPWEEIHWDAKTWLVPKERMKGNKLHRVPLSDPALELLLEMQKLRRNDHPFVFPGQRPRKGLSHAVMLSVLRQMGIDATVATVHGMRSSFRDWCSEVDHTEFAVAEAALAHSVGSTASLAYNRTDYLERRREVMSAWAKYICGDNASNVVPLRSAVTA